MALPKLSAQQPIAGALKPTSAFLEFMERTRAATEAQLTDLGELVAAVVAINVTQQAQIDRLTTSLRAISHTDGLFVTAAADGATAKIVITAHTRTYTDLTASLDAGSITGLDYSTTYSVYYDDEDRTGGAVTYLATELPSEAVTSSDHPYRHLIGAVTTPATSGSPPTDGGASTPPGYPPQFEYEIP